MRLQVNWPLTCPGRGTVFQEVFPVSGQATWASYVGSIHDCRQRINYNNNYYSVGITRARPNNSLSGSPKWELDSTNSCKPKRWSAKLFSETHYYKKITKKHMQQITIHVHASGRGCCAWFRQHHSSGDGHFYIMGTTHRWVLMRTPESIYYRCQFTYMCYMTQ